jgi:hypothetical protein
VHCFPNEEDTKLTFCARELLEIAGRPAAAAENQRIEVQPPRHSSQSRQKRIYLGGVNIPPLSAHAWSNITLDHVEDAVAMVEI